MSDDRTLTAAATPGAAGGRTRTRRRRRTLVAATLAVAASGGFAAERAIDKEVVVAAPIETVWRTWTTRDGIRTFFAPDAEIDARVGGAFHIYINPLAEPGMKGADEMRFMALEPPSMLSFDWNAPPSLPEIRAQRTFVVVRLARLAANSTRVTLHHTGWGEGGAWDQAFAYFDRAWGNVLGNLKQSFDSGPIDWTEWMERMRAAAGPASAASASR